jgi:phosphoglycolate phosphatase
MFSSQRLIVLDADGTTIDAFSALGRTFQLHGMELGDLERFQKRRNLFKYLGGLKEFPSNLRQQLGKQKRKALIATLTQIYREEASLYPGMAELILELKTCPEVRLGLVTRNITEQPHETLRLLFQRHGVDLDRLDFFIHVPLSEDKAPYFAQLLEQFAINPALAFACGDERKDYQAALQNGFHPFIVSYGFEDHDRLVGKIGVPEVLISRTPEQLRQRLLHAIGIPASSPATYLSQPMPQRSWGKTATAEDESHLAPDRSLPPTPSRGEGAVSAPSNTDTSAFPGGREQTSAARLSQ